MDWFLVSLASAAVFSSVSVLDKVVLARMPAGPMTFIAGTGLLQFPGALIPLAFVPLAGYSFGVWTIAVMAGVLMGASLVAMFWMLSRREVSEVIAVYQTSPIFVAILAVFLLSEVLTAFQWLAILVTIAGAVLISLQRSDGTRGLRLGSSFHLLVLASALAAGGQFLTKAALEEGMSFWNLHTVRAASLGMTMAVLLARPTVLRELRVVASDRRVVGLWILAEAIIALPAIVLTQWGVSLGPVSLTTTVMSSRPLFVFGVSALLSTGAVRLLNEPLDRDTLTKKGASIVMIIAGIGALSLL